MGLFKKQKATYFEGDRVEYADQDAGKWRRGTIISIDQPLPGNYWFWIDFDDDPDPGNGGRMAPIMKGEEDRIRKVG